MTRVAHNDHLEVLLTPTRLGSLALPNRIVMSPLTRCRAGPNFAATDMMSEYYAQRAEAGLIVTEGIPVSPQAVGYAGVSGLWSDDLARSWRKVTEAVHEKGGRIVAQLWHVGRLSDPIFLDGETPVAPSALPPNGTVTMVRPKRPWVIPRALRADEMPQIVEQFATAARMALSAGFDGIEIHGANGYLFDQFLQGSSNIRTDEYGGAPENRMRLLLEVVDRLSDLWPADRIGVHLSPRSGHSVSDPDPEGLFCAVAEALSTRALAFLYLREARAADSVAPKMRALFKGGFVLNEKLTTQTGAEVIRSGAADAVGFGKPFIANPDLVDRVAQDLPLSDPRPETFYSGGAEGYTDYPRFDGAIS